MKPGQGDEEVAGHAGVRMASRWGKSRDYGESRSLGCTNRLSRSSGGERHNEMIEPRFLTNLLVVVALSAAYFVAGKLGLLLAFVHHSATAVWPPTGITLAALLALGYHVWPGIFLGAFLVNITTAGSVATSLGIAVGNTLEGLVGAFLVKRFANWPLVFDQPKDVLRF